MHQCRVKFLALREKERQCPSRHWNLRCCWSAQTRRCEARQKDVLNLTTNLKKPKPLQQTPQKEFVQSKDFFSPAMNTTKRMCWMQGTFSQQWTQQKTPVHWKELFTRASLWKLHAIQAFSKIVHKRRKRLLVLKIYLSLKYYRMASRLM